jgi:predicted regulator of Ras-like GTPase activity (Roadblock/LC7/MglB family)
MTSPYAAILDGLTRQRGVRASLIVSENDGLVVDSRVRVGEQEDRVAALAASIYRKARRSARAAHLGSVAFLQLDAEQGRVCAVGRQDLVIVVLADPAANVGMIRVALLKAVGTLQ